MHVIVNGQSTELPPGASLEDLVARLGLDAAICAAELNRRLIPRDRRAQTLLAEGDTVEIVTLVGGG